MKNYRYGHFNEDGTEFTITDPETPRAFDNFIWNDAVFSNVQQTGVGYMDYQIGKNEAVQMLTGIGRICDFDVFGRDHLMSRLIYVRDNDTGEYWNVNWEPVKRKPGKFECTHGLGYSIVKSETCGIESTFRIFIPAGKDPVELWTLETSNKSSRKRNLSIFIYNQMQFKFKWGFDSYGDMIFRTSWYSKQQNAVIANKHPHHRPHDYLTGFLAADLPIVAWDGTRDAFVGMYNTLCNPSAVTKGKCTNTPGSSDATICAAQFNFKLNPGSSKKIDLILGATDCEKNISPFRKKYFGRFEKYFTGLKKGKAEMIARNHVETPDKQFNLMCNSWIKQSTLYGATWCRWGWNGYRDIVQHGFGVSSFKPERTREILLEAFTYQYKRGLALRGWNPVDEKAYSDSALWLVFTLIAYLKETGDFSILKEKIKYYDDGEATVRGHIETALDFLESNKGSHGLILIKFGDWNDSLTAVGKKGRGESVWLSEAYAEAVKEMAELAAYEKDSSREKDYLARYARIKSAINSKAWDGKWYTRCFDDNGDPVGSNKNPQGKIFIEAQAWALISGIADEKRVKTTVQSCDKMLLSDLGYALLHPTFYKTEDRIGRISCMEPGICENGTIYSHTNAWMILGLLKCGMVEKAYEIFRRITPGYLNGKTSDPKQACPPYIFANCYYGTEHRNRKFQMEFTWITGSVAWYNNILLQYMLGARAELGGLRIDPRLPAGWKKCSVDRTYRNALYKITIHNPKGLANGKVSVKVDGKAISGNLIPIIKPGKTCKVDVVIGYIQPRWI